MVPVIAGGELFSMGVVRARQFYIVNKGPVREKPRNLVDLAVLESHAGHVVLRGPPPGATPYVRHQETDGWSPSLAANWWVHLRHPHPGWLPVGHGQPTPSPRTPCNTALPSQSHTTNWRVCPKHRTLPGAVRNPSWPTNWSVTLCTTSPHGFRQLVGAPLHVHRHVPLPLGLCRSGALRMAIAATGK